MKIKRMSILLFETRWTKALFYSNQQSDGSNGVVQTAERQKTV